MEHKYVYAFEEGNKDMRSLMGGKGANLAEMTVIGLPVPPGFTVTTQACNRFYEENEELWDALLQEVKEHLGKVEEKLGKSFSDPDNPLLMSVRSGAVFSMPGMMDTILNLGLNDESVQGLARSTDNERFAYDSYRRFIQMFGDVAMEVPKSYFDEALEARKESVGAAGDTDLTAEDLKALVEDYKQIIRREFGEEFPQDPVEQLKFAIKAVFKSWNNNRARVYRRLHHIPDDLGTAVNVQAMVFGNMGDTSGTGVAFTRNPATGENKLFGEFLMNAQGEDVVAGIRTPNEISQLKDIMPKAYDEFVNVTHKLEEHYKDMQDIEFTIEDEKLFILQTRSGKRTSHAAIQVAVDLVEDGVISKEEAILRVEPDGLNQLLHPTFDEEELKRTDVIAKGLPASPGAASGKIYFHADDVAAANARGERAILVRQETSPEDIEGMVAAQGILTARGGMTSHAAVVARGMGKCCVAGTSTLRINEQLGTMRAGDLEFNEGDYISLDGSTGEVFAGDIKKVDPILSGAFGTFMSWVDDIRTLKVRTNADNPRDAKQAVQFGAEGIGLCRTEHMFFMEDRIPAVRRMILANTQEQREEPLQKILPMQRQDFYEIYQVMEDRPVTIRLLDPPLHEFLPTDPEDIRELALTMHVSEEELQDRVNELHEFNPMLGHRGCRLAVTYPEIYRMQARAIIEAALLIKKDGNVILPEIMIPLVSDPNELVYVKKEVIEEIEMVFEEQNDRVEYLVGTMIEIPRACLLADEIAREADFFSFGTNDLTQMGYGFSRDDAGTFLHEYVDKNIFSNDPFDSLDQKGIGKLVETAAKLGREANPELHLGICGEHGGDPRSVEFFHRTGLDYVSCSPFRVPIARLAAAQAVARESTETRKDV
ncbi:MAG: pyruvate, phosphate dikinase [Tissierellia bacterium]|jgi:pyruvate,orthophosphate dikinase|nr:pyruvate, phosphate dikinase [Bacillota bacterium]NLK58808.1 pyruvate, phosphate dikinase [Tissierellia bacterium]